MKMKKAFMTTCWSAFISIVVMAAAQSSAEQSISQTFHKKTDQVIYTFEVSERMQAARLKVVARVNGGQAEWQLKSPDGEVYLRGFGDGGRVVTDTDQFKPTSGVWKLEIKLMDASGNYRFNWTAH